MGIGRKLGRLVLDGLRKVNREASHPGRPQSFRAGDSPFWEDPAAKAEKTKEAARRMAERDGDVPEAVKQARAEAAEPKGGNLKETGEEPTPWYLQGEEDLDGWDNTNALDAD